MGVQFDETIDLLRKKMKEKGGPLTDSEAFDFYVDHVMTTEVSCKLNQWKRNPKTGERGVREDYALWELDMKAKGWHKQAIGRLVICGAVGLRFPEIVIE